MLLIGVFNLDSTGRWIDPGNIDRNLLYTYMQDVAQSQDSLSGVSELPTFEELSGGRSVEEVRQIGVNADEEDGDSEIAESESSEYHRARVNEQYGAHEAPFAESISAARDEEILRKRAEAQKVLNELEEKETGKANKGLALYDLDEDELNPNVSVLSVDDAPRPNNARGAYGPVAISTEESPRR